MKSSDKKELPALILITKILESKVKDINISMISADAYYITYYLEKDKAFVILMRDIQYQADKKTRVKINPKSVVP